MSEPEDPTSEEFEYLVGDEEDEPGLFYAQLAEDGTVNALISQSGDEGYLLVEGRPIHIDQAEAVAEQIERESAEPQRETPDGDTVH